MFRRRGWFLAGALVALALTAPGATAAPTEVNLRVEGPSATLFEGPVVTDDSPLSGGDGTGAHACGAPGASPGAALQASGLSWRGRWNADFQDFFLDGVAGFSSVPADLAYWSILVDWKYALGMCRSTIRDGDEILFAFGAGPSPQTLRLSGPKEVEMGRGFTVTVRDGWIRGGSGSDGGPVEGASVGGATTDAQGHAEVTLSSAGVHELKATLPGAVRSNGLAVSARDEPIGPPQPPGEEPTGPLVRTPAAGERYAARASTRILRGGATGPVSIRLEGARGRRCTKLTPAGVLGSRSCRTRAPLIRTTSRNGEWSFRLRGPLASGRYRLAVRSGQKSIARRFTVAARPGNLRGAVRHGIGWLRRVQLPNGSFALDPGGAESVLATDWAAIALGRSAPRSRAFRRVIARVRVEPRRGLSSLIRASLAVARSPGRIDQARLRSIRREIAGLQDDNGSWGGQVSPTAYALASLRGGGHRADIARGRAWLAAQPPAPDADTIGATLWALRRSVPRGPAVAALRDLQGDDGGFAAQAGGSTNAQSTALAVLGLRSAGIDPRRFRSDTGISPLDYLRARQRPAGRVDYRLGMRSSSVWVTSQALFAISSSGP